MRTHPLETSHNNDFNLKISKTLQIKFQAKDGKECLAKGMTAEVTIMSVMSNETILKKG